MNAPGVASSSRERGMPHQRFIDERVPVRLATSFDTSTTKNVSLPGVTRSVISYLYVPQ